MPTTFRDTLSEVHRALLTAVQRGWERLYGRIDGPGELLQLAVHDPLFAWLRPLSALLAELDEGDATARATVAGWIADDDFGASYRHLLQTDPDVVVAHAALRRHLNPLKGLTA